MIQNKFIDFLKLNAISLNDSAPNSCIFAALHDLFGSCIGGVDPPLF